MILPLPLLGGGAAGNPDGKRSKPGKMMLPWTLLPGSATCIYDLRGRIPGADAAALRGEDEVLSQHQSGNKSSKTKVTLGVTTQHSQWKRPGRPCAVGTGSILLALTRS